MTIQMTINHGQILEEITGKSLRVSLAGHSDPGQFGRMFVGLESYNDL